MTTPTTVYRSCPDVVARTVAGEHLLVPVGGPLARANRLFTLNRFGLEIWEAIDGARDAAAVAAAVAERHPGEEERVRADTGVFMDELARIGLIVPQAGEP